MGSWFLSREGVEKSGGLVFVICDSLIVVRAMVDDIDKRVIIYFMAICETTISFNCIYLVVS